MYCIINLKKLLINIYNENKNFESHKKIFFNITGAKYYDILQNKKNKYKSNFLNNHKYLINKVVSSLILNDLVINALKYIKQKYSKGFDPNTLSKFNSDIKYFQDIDSLTNNVLTYEKFIDIPIFLSLEVKNQTYINEPTGYYKTLQIPEQDLNYEITFTNIGNDKSTSNLLQFTTILNDLENTFDYDTAIFTNDVIGYILAFLIPLFTNNNFHNKYTVFKFCFSSQHNNEIIVNKLKLILVTIILYFILHLKEYLFFSIDCIFFADFIYKTNNPIIYNNFNQSFICKYFKSIKNYFIKYVCYSRDNNIDFIGEDKDYLINGKVYVNYNTNANLLEKFNINLSFPYNNLIKNHNILTQITNIEDDEHTKLHKLFKLYNKEGNPLLSSDNNYYSISQFNNYKLFHLFKVYKPKSPNILNTQIINANKHVNKKYTEYVGFFNLTPDFVDFILDTLQQNIFNNGPSESLLNIDMNAFIKISIQNKVFNPNNVNNKIKIYEDDDFWKKLYINNIVYTKKDSDDCTVDYLKLYSLLGNYLYMNYYILHFLIYLSIIGIKYIGTYYELYFPQKYDIYFTIIDADLFFYRFFNIFNKDEFYNSIIKTNITIQDLIKSLVLFGFKKIAKHLLNYLISAYYFILTIKDIIQIKKDFIYKKVFLFNLQFNSVPYYISYKVNSNYLNLLKSNCKPAEINNNYLKLENELFSIRLRMNIEYQYSNKTVFRLSNFSNYEIVKFQKTNNNSFYFNSKLMEYTLGMIPIKFDKLIEKNVRKICNLSKSSINGLKKINSINYYGFKLNILPEYLFYVKWFNVLIHISQHYIIRDNDKYLLSSLSYSKNEYIIPEITILFDSSNVTFNLNYQCWIKKAYDKIFKDDSNAGKVFIPMNLNADIDKIIKNEDFIENFLKLIYTSYNDQKYYENYNKPIYILSIRLKLQNIYDSHSKNNLWFYKLKILTYLCIFYLLIYFRYPIFSCLKEIFFQHEFSSFPTIYSDKNGYIIFGDLNKTPLHYNIDTYINVNSIYENYINNALLYKIPSNTNFIKLTSKYHTININHNHVYIENNLIKFTIKLHKYYYNIIRYLQDNALNLNIVLRHKYKGDLVFSDSHIDSIFISLSELINQKVEYIQKEYTKKDNVQLISGEIKTIKNKILGREYLEETSFKKGKHKKKGPIIYIIIRNWYSKFFKEQTYNIDQLKLLGKVFFGNIYYFFVNHIDDLFHYHPDKLCYSSVINELFKEKGCASYIINNKNKDNNIYSSNNLAFNQIVYDDKQDFCDYLLIDQSPSSNGLPLSLIKNMKDKHNILYLFGNNLVFIFKYIQGIIIYLQFLGITFIGSLYDFFYPKTDVMYFCIINCANGIDRLINISVTNEKKRIIKLKNSLCTFGFKNIANNLMTFIFSFNLLLLYHIVRCDEFTTKYKINYNFIFGTLIQPPSIEISIKYTYLKSPKLLYEIFQENINKFFDIKNWLNESIETHIIVKLPNGEEFINIENNLIQ